MRSEDVPKFSQHQAFHNNPAFDGVKVRSLSHTDTLPAGSWSLVVQNTENLLNTLIVHVKIVGDPS